MEKRVVITGMGIWSCLGTTLDEFPFAFLRQCTQSRFETICQS